MKSVLFVVLFAMVTFAAEAADGNSNRSDSVYVLCEMPDEEDPESAVMSNIGVTNDSLAPLGEYVEWADSSTSAADTSRVDSTTLSAISDSTVVDLVAADSSVSKDTIPSTAEKSIVKSVDKNIPLPRQTVYLEKGLSFGFGAGIYNPTEECDCIGTWQAQLEFYYTPRVSAGIDVRFLGGDLDSDVMIMYQRYRLNLRVHQAWKNLDLYVEPVFGFENTSISEFRRQVREHISGNENEGSNYPSSGSSEEDSTSASCEKMFSLDGFSLGVGLGGGYVLSRFFGATGSVLLEYNFSRAVQLTLTPGLAFNMQSVWTWARETLKSAWISVEIGSQRYFNRGVNDWALFGFLGVQFAI
ncbi:MAG: hypothetical protein MJZ22_04365 [Candidatus Saccharibacteria bacterium]|nr:hypothetical protein [Candidatus Saccharibacteria bacterium]